MRVALAKSTLRIPPSYFALNHAERLHAEHEFRMFTLAAEIRDPELTVPVRDFVPFRTLPFRQRERAIPLFMGRMAAAILSFRPDVIHQHFATWSKPAVDAAVAGSHPLVTTLHGADVMAALRRPRGAMQRWNHFNISLARKQSDRVLAVSGYLASQAVKAGFDASRIHVHYQGVDTDFFTPRGHVSAPDPRPLVLFVGSLSYQKGARDLLSASRGLMPALEHDLVFIGDGPLEAELRREAAGSEHVQFLGPLARVSVRDWLRRATVMVLPTQEYNGRREAAGLVLLESQACGTPVVAYNSGGTSEMLDVDTTGLLAPEKDVSALQRALHDVLSLPASEYSLMRESARSFVESQRSLTGSCAELIEHYEAVAV